ncbi:hypothetical protein Hanom_Chr06g00578221 [Helianthus anomalus]
MNKNVNLVYLTSGISCKSQCGNNFLKFVHICSCPWCKVFSGIHNCPNIIFTAY